MFTYKSSEHKNLKPYFKKYIYILQLGAVGAVAPSEHAWLVSRRLGAREEVEDGRGGVVGVLGFRKALVGEALVARVRDVSTEIGVDGVAKGLRDDDVDVAGVVRHEVRWARLRRRAPVRKELVHLVVALHDKLEPREVFGGRFHVVVGDQAVRVFLTELVPRVGRGDVLLARFKAPVAIVPLGGVRYLEVRRPYPFKLHHLLLQEGHGLRVLVHLVLPDRALHRRQIPGELAAERARVRLVRVQFGLARQLTVGKRRRVDPKVFGQPSLDRLRARHYYALPERLLRGVSVVRKALLLGLEARQKMVAEDAGMIIGIPLVVFVATHLDVLGIYVILSAVKPAVLVARAARRRPVAANKIMKKVARRFELLRSVPRFVTEAVRPSGCREL